MKHWFAFLFASLLGLSAMGQGDGSCVILGKVVDATTNAPLPFATVVLQGASTGAATDFDGKYRLEGVPSGVHNVVMSFLGNVMVQI